MPKSRYPVNYVENNLIRTQDGQWWAYYELMPYNYSFLSPDKKRMARDRLRQALSQISSGSFHLLHLVTEASIETVQEKGKALVTGNLADHALWHIDAQTEELIAVSQEHTGSVHQLEPRCFIGFRLAEMSSEQGLSGIVSRITDSFGDFVRSVNTNLAGDYVRVGAEERNRFFRSEQFLEKQISSYLKIRKLDPNDLGYIIAHLSGQRGVPHEAYKWHLDTKEYPAETLVRHYDLLAPASSLIKEKPRRLQIEHECGTSHVAYFTLYKVIGELSFPGCEVLYDQGRKFAFPVDVSMKVEVVPNTKAVSKLRDKKKSLEDVAVHAHESGNTPTRSLEEAIELAEDLEHVLDETKEPMYWASYLVRVAADDADELERRAAEVSGYYDTHFGFKIRRLMGSMEGSHYEFFPGGKIHCQDLKQPVDSAFLASLGFGATEILGETHGFYIGYNGNIHVYLQPQRAAQAVEGADTNSLAVSVTGATGYGKSMAVKTMLYNAVLCGARAVLIEPKNECGGWLEYLPELTGEYNVVDIKNRPENQGLLDPFVIMEHDADAAALALEVLSYLTNVTLNKDPDRYPALKRAIGRVVERPRGKRGMLHVIAELRNEDTVISNKLAEHIDAYATDGNARLLFSDGNVQNRIQLDKQLNVIQVADLDLPRQEVAEEDYSNNEILGTALLLVIGTFTKDFMRSDKGIYKMVMFEEAWMLLGTAKGAALVTELVRMGRSLNSGVYVISQSVRDFLDERLKSNMGLRFAFNPGGDMKEIQSILEYFGLDPEDKGAQASVRDLNAGECLFRDLNGHVGMMKVDMVFPELYHAFDTSTKEQTATVEEVASG